MNQRIGWQHKPPDCLKIKAHLFFVVEKMTDLTEQTKLATQKCKLIKRIPEKYSYIMRSQPVIFYNLCTEL